MPEQLPQNLFGDPEIAKNDARLLRQRQQRKGRNLVRRRKKVSSEQQPELGAEAPFDAFINEVYKKIDFEIEEQMTDVDGYATLSLELKRMTYNDLAEKFIKYGPKKTGLVLHDFFKQIYDTYKTAEQDVDVINYFLEKIGNDIRVMVVEKTENYKMIYKIDNAR